MKNLFTKHVLAIGIALILVSGCNFSSKTKEKKGTTSSGQKPMLKLKCLMQ
jgi:hypothetical protein